MNILYNYERYIRLVNEVAGNGEWEFAFAWNAAKQINTSFRPLNSIKYLIESCFNEIKNNGKYTTYLILKNKFDERFNMNFLLNLVRKTPQNYINLLYEIFFNGLDKVDGYTQEILTEIHKKLYN